MWGFNKKQLVKAKLNVGKCNITIRTINETYVSQFIGYIVGGMYSEEWTVNATDVAKSFIKNSKNVVEVLPNHFIPFSEIKDIKISKIEDHFV